MFLNKIRNIFCVPETKFVSATNVARAGKRENICVRNNVSSFARAFIHVLAVENFERHTPYSKMAAILVFFCFLAN